MSATSTFSPAAGSIIDSFVVPSLAKLLARRAKLAVKTAGAPKLAGLSVADIADASLRATVKGGLQVRRDPYRYGYAR